MNYADKLGSLREIFAGEILNVSADNVVTSLGTFPVVDGVIIALAPEHYPPYVQRRLGVGACQNAQATTTFAPDIQFTFGSEWQTFPRVLPEHEDEFRKYFDIVDQGDLQNKRVCDLGCGIGRWSYYLAPKCKEVVLVDFSEAIFIARKNLAHATNTIFVIADIKALPFRKKFCDLIACIGVLHHLPSDALSEVRALRRYGHDLLIYLYYALDNRPFYFRMILAWVTAVRLGLSRVRSHRIRLGLSHIGALLVYRPLVALGTVLDAVGLGRYVPLYAFYRGKSQQRLAQDVYDRFFTRIEQRVSRAEILNLKSDFRCVTVSEGDPYWHFLCSDF